MESSSKYNLRVRKPKCYDSDAAKITKSERKLGNGKAKVINAPGDEVTTISAAGGNEIQAKKPVVRPLDRVLNNPNASIRIRLQVPKSVPKLVDNEDVREEILVGTKETWLDALRKGNVMMEEDLKGEYDYEMEALRYRKEKRPTANLGEKITKLLENYRVSLKTRPYLVYLVNKLRKKSHQRIYMEQFKKDIRSLYTTGKVPQRILKPNGRTLPSHSTLKPGSEVSLKPMSSFKDEEQQIRNVRPPPPLVELEVETTALPLMVDSHKKAAEESPPRKMNSPTVMDSLLLQCLNTLQEVPASPRLESSNLITSSQEVPASPRLESSNLITITPSQEVSALPRLRLESSNFTQEAPAFPGLESNNFITFSQDVPAFPRLESNNFFTPSQEVPAFPRLESSNFFTPSQDVPAFPRLESNNFFTHSQDVPAFPRLESNNFFTPSQEVPAFPRLESNNFFTPSQEVPAFPRLESNNFITPVSLAGVASDVQYFTAGSSNVSDFADCVGTQEPMNNFNGSYIPIISNNNQQCNIWEQEIASQQLRVPMWSDSIPGNQHQLSTPPHQSPTSWTMVDNNLNFDDWNWNQPATLPPELEDIWALPELSVTREFMLHSPI